MKKYLFTMVVVLIILTFTLNIHAAGQGQRGAVGQGQRGAMGQGQRGAMGQGQRGAMGQRGGTMRFRTMDVEAVNEAIAEIELQVAVLKKAMEGAEPMNMGGQRGGQRGGRGGGQIQIGGLDEQGAEQQRGAGQRGGGDDMQAMMAQMQARTEAVQAAATAISNQLLILDSTPAQTEITELQAAAAQAAQAEDTETAEMLQAMITARQEAAQAVGVNIGGRGGARGGARGAGFGGFGGGRGGGYTPPPGGFQYEDD